MSSIGNKEVFARNLRYYVEKSGKSQRDLCAIVGVSTSTFNDWVRAKKYPRIDKIEILADYFGIMKSDLIEEKEDTMAKNDVLTDIIVRLRTDKEFFTVVEHIVELDTDKLLSIHTLLK